LQHDKGEDQRKTCTASSRSGLMKIELIKLIPHVVW